MKEMTLPSSQRIFKFKPWRSEAEHATTTLGPPHWAENNTCCFGNAWPKSNARAHLKQGKNIVVLYAAICGP